jgi:hypothetical protein
MYKSYENHFFTIQKLKEVKNTKFRVFLDLERASNTKSSNIKKNKKLAIYPLLPIFFLSLSKTSTEIQSKI